MVVENLGLASNLSGIKATITQAHILYFYDAKTYTIADYIRIKAGSLQEVDSK
jgi:hypothetical protein